MENRPPRLALVSSEHSTVDPDLIDQIESLGGECLNIRVHLEGTRERLIDHESPAKLLEDLIAFDPDAVLTVNRKGLGENSPLLFFCEVFRIPLVVWYADNPFYLVIQKHECRNECLTLLVYDPAFAKPLRDFGARRVDVLPFATNPAHFSLPRGKKASKRKYPISFVGALGILQVRQILKTLEERLGPEVFAAIKPSVLRLVEEGGRWLLENPVGSPFVYMDDVHAGDGALEDFMDSLEVRALLATLIDFQACCAQRTACVQKLLPLGIEVWGEESWKMAVPENRFHGRVPWHKIQRIYQQSRLVLNVSRFQILNSVTQRFFDVPLCGAVLLTDNRPGVAEYFKPGGEVLVYEGPDDLAERAREALEDRGALDAISAAARAKILREHTYAQRMVDIQRIGRESRERMAALGEASVEREPQLRDRCEDFFGAWLEEGEIATVERVLERLERTTPGDAGLLAWRAGCAYHARRYDEAADLIARARTKDPSNRIARMFATLLAMTQGEMDLAAELADALLGECPDREEYRRLAIMIDAGLT